jgi:hypothetical protein
VPAASTAPDSDGRPTADRPGAALKRFYGQELAFQPCGDDDATTSTEADVLAGSDPFECARAQKRAWTKVSIAPG